MSLILTFIFIICGNCQNCMLNIFIFIDFCFVQMLVKIWRIIILICDSNPIKNLLTWVIKSFWITKITSGLVEKNVINSLPYKSWYWVWLSSWIRSSRCSTISCFNIEGISSFSFSIKDCIGQYFSGLSVDFKMLISFSSLYNVVIDLENLVSIFVIWYKDD